MSNQIEPRILLDFWRTAGAEKWFARDALFDAAFDDRFRDAHFAAARRELESWMGDAEGALALVLLLDQFPRNCFRGSAHSYATDGLARHYAQRAIDAGFDLRVEAALRSFFYLPFEHSESLADQEFCVELCAALQADSGDENTVPLNDTVECRTVTASEQHVMGKGVLIYGFGRIHR